MRDDEKALRAERDRLRAEIEKAERAQAAGFLGIFFSKHPIAPATRAIPSSRPLAEIRAEVRELYRRRPRPWRWHGARA